MSSSSQPLYSDSDSGHDEDGFRRCFPFRWAAYILLGIFALTTSYHVLILSRVIPYKYTWGGRLKDVNSMLRFETISLCINLFLVVLVLLRGRFCCPTAPQGVLKVFCWIFCLVFALNTLGNLMAHTWFEMLAFTPMTLVASLCFMRLAIEAK